MDNAVVNITSDIAINILTQSEECYKCILLPSATNVRNETVLVDTRWKTRLKITTDDVSIKSNCSEKDLSMHFKEHGIYTIRINVTADAKLNCSVQLTKSPKSSFIVRLTSSTEIHVSGNHAEAKVQAGRGSSDAKSKKERLKSLDTFRGISIVIMVFVNYGGGGYWFFSHSKWNGLTVADLVFPWFVFIMGTSMIYSFASLLRNDTPKYKIFWKIFRRSCILFILGLVINTNGSSSVDMTELRIPGVLQRFAVTYFITATVHMFVAKLPDTMTDKRFKDITDYWVEWIIISWLILVHTCLTFLLDVPGCGKGYLGPGGLENNSTHHNCTGGAAGYIDRQVFGERHIFGSPTCKCLLAGILCKFSKNDGWIPVNKNLWSLSFVFCLGGFAFLLLCFCYLTIDEWKMWNGAPFYYPVKRTSRGQLVKRWLHEETANMTSFTSGSRKKQVSFQPKDDLVLLREIHFRTSLPGTRKHYP
ncbi:HGSNAT [Mytilus coruscus]|uniref:HGSNAT n=1 Tax=Mytilus coruscus TaxID=42192 RepID=A0A6J8DR10_MYTCO|nr:HGSNAT [Mytilus coruscus]